MDWSAIIRAVSPRAKVTIVAGLAEAMPRLIKDYEISTPLRQAHFLAQLAHESDGFTTTIEYASGDAYDTRTDLGNTAAKDGDGRLYKGYGLIQMTGKANQQKVAAYLGIEALWRKNPRVLAQFPAAALSAGWFWKTRGLNKFADADDVRSITRRINGGFNGLVDRQKYLARAKAILAKQQVAELPAPESRDTVKAFQTQLASLGFHEVGTADGQIGDKTVAALAAFQTQNALPLTGDFDITTKMALVSATESRVVSEARATGLPIASRILDAANVLKKGGGLVAAGAAAFTDPVINTVTGAWDMVSGLFGDATGDPMGALQTAMDLFYQAQTLLAPFETLFGFVASNKTVFLVAGGLAVYAYAKKIKDARIEDHQTGKTA